MLTQGCITGKNKIKQKHTQKNKKQSHQLKLKGQYIEHNYLEFLKNCIDELKKVMAGTFIFTC